MYPGRSCDAPGETFRDARCLLPGFSLSIEVVGRIKSFAHSGSFARVPLGLTEQDYGITPFDNEKFIAGLKSEGISDLARNHDLIFA